MVDEETLEAHPQYQGQHRYFDAEFARYGHYRLEPWRVSYLERLRAAGLLESRGNYLLDIGVGGTGYTVIEAARVGAYAVGCDLSLGG